MVKICQTGLLKLGRPWMKLKIFFCQFPNPWALRVSGIGGYTSKCEKSQNHCTLLSMAALHSLFYHSCLRHLFYLFTLVCFVMYALYTLPSQSVSLI
jgi:hypothetical protein